MDLVRIQILFARGITCVLNTLTFLDVIKIIFIEQNVGEGVFMIGVQILDPIALQIMLKTVNENASRLIHQMIANISFTTHQMKNVGSILDRSSTMTFG